MKNPIGSKHSIFFRTALFVFAAMFLSTLLVGLAVALLIRIGFIRMTDPLGLVLNVTVTSSIIGSLISAMAFRRTLRIVDSFLDGMKEIRKGNYGVRIGENSPNERIRYLAENFNLMSQELSGIETLRSDFINSFSHEFKTPISSIKGFAKLLKNPNLSEEERQDYLDIIISESERLSRLASGTMDITKVESLESVPERKMYRLDEQIRQCILLLEPRWSKKKLTVDVDLTEIDYTGSEDLLQQVWINLIDNAVKFTADGGEIAVSLSRVQNNAIATVSDNGCGMDAETQKHMFDKFFQGDPSRSMEGIGVGLSLVKKIVKVSQGRIKVRSALNEGTSITVVLPVSTETPDE